MALSPTHPTSPPNLAIGQCLLHLPYGPQPRCHPPLLLITPSSSHRLPPHTWPGNPLPEWMRFSSSSSEDITPGRRSLSFTEDVCGKGKAPAMEDSEISPFPGAGSTRHTRSSLWQCSSGGGFMVDARRSAHHLLWHQPRQEHSSW
jgi:hypothetical protein